MGKVEIARYKQFLLFPQRFLLSQIIISPLVNIFDIISLFAVELEEPKIGIWGEGLNQDATMHEGVVSHNTPYLKVIIYWWQKPL